MKRLNSPDGQGVLHFVTLKVRDRKTPFRRAEYARMICELLRFECDRHPATLVAFVVMPDHIHALLGPSDGELTRFLQRFKPNATRNLDALALQMERQRDRDWLSEKGPRELWQDGKYSLPIYSPEWIREKIDYIHSNPIRKGLVDDASAYPWSSYGAYCPESLHVPPVAVDLVK
ncbi:putative transposase [Abditibacterium utsteinense]|uniref:Putative transposase n=1 Tax=Abditibacterium utsteinense TaxID=1960156 RepID=A0A2S8SWG2_9BACT|nr:transposase [Abditibacterium utsteinense]PQV65130.1 putative transposase [Abditibacterium utsteinense]